MFVEFFGPFQLDLFDTVMNEDRKDAVETGMVDDGGSDMGRLEEREFLPDPPAVASMRSVMEKLGDQEEMRSVVEIIAANMERMVVAHSSEKHWKKIRCGLVGNPCV